MKILQISDIHAGFSRETQTKLSKFLKKNKKLIEEADLMVGCGDWVSHSQKSFPLVFKLFRKAFGNKPILAVLGNHDFWSAESFNPNYQSPFKSERLTYHTMREQQRKWMQEYNIHYLSDEEYEKDGVIFFGYDGYYKQIPPCTNDKNYMPQIAREVPIHQYLNWKAYKQLDSLLMRAKEIDKVKYKLVCVTHFNMTLDVGWEHMAGDPRHLELLSEVPFNLVMWGHNHKEEDFIFRETRFTNAGGDYDFPCFKMVEI